MCGVMKENFDIKVIQVVKAPMKIIRQAISQERCLQNSLRF
jgi:hypothetical protein